MLNGKPLCVELFCGCFGWSAGWLAEGGIAIGFDIEHFEHHGPVPDGAMLVLQDASAMIAKIPLPLSTHIARVYKPFRER